MNPSLTPSTSSAAAEYSAGKKLMAAIKAENGAVQQLSHSREVSADRKFIQSAADSIPPTVVDAERAFSAPGIFCTKLRSRLSDNSTDTLCFLRA